ncbi:glycoside hydrolase family 88 protein [Thalassotalea euphylliae]|uniref:glycoside hydrolase family 88 protein n=1 Tax=Thalassotalea euphylliae TaxID=1655234 RepID=UPI0015F28E25|nr:glycoside hydrolase family 88 protein [Thalassotalea euphylliae]
MKSIYLLLPTILALLVGCNSSTSTNNEVETIPPENFSFPITKSQVLDLAIAKYKLQATRLSPDEGYIREATNGQWHQQNWKDWTDGFFPGVLWQLALLDESLIPLADKWTTPLEGHKDFDNHDLGFIFNNSYGKALRLTNDDKYSPPLEFAANHLSRRYSPQVMAIRSWDFGNFAYPVIIDNMMNLDLLWYSAKQYNLANHYQIAEQHALTTQQNHLRDNGTSFHLVDFSPSSGEVVNKQTVQGFANSSTWARGQAWGIYGFTLAYVETNNKNFLASAQKLADYFISTLPTDGVPAWDFDLRADQNIKDSSAAVIAASAIWQLSQAVSSEESIRYQQASKALINNLLNDNYLDINPNSPALLKKASGNVPANKEVETSLIYADYYFIEVLMLQINKITLPS